MNIHKIVTLATTVQQLPFTGGEGKDVDLSHLGEHIGVTRTMAMQLPAIRRQLSTLLAVATVMPLKMVNNFSEERNLPWLENPTGGAMTKQTLLKRTIEDLWFDGHALWTVEERYASPKGRVGFPTRFRHWPVGSFRYDAGRRVWVCQQNDTTTPYGEPRAETYEYNVQDGVYFEGLDAGILHEGGASVILDGLRIQRAIRQSIDQPIPAGYLTPATVGREVPADQVSDILAAWAAARRTGRWSYLPSWIRAEVNSFSPRDRQLLEIAKQTDIDQVRATAGSPEDIGISTTSRTYQNTRDARDDYLRQDVARYTSPVAARLSMADITPTGYKVVFDTITYTWGSDLDRFTAYEKGLAVGVYADMNEVRVTEGKKPIKLKEPQVDKSKNTTENDPAEEPQNVKEDNG